METLPSDEYHPSGPFEMSIRIGGYQTGSTFQPCDLLTELPLKLIESDPITISRVKSCVFEAIVQGYKSIVYNFVRHGNSQLIDRDICTFKGFDLEKIFEEG